MIDVTFLLLIFFICTIKFKTLEGKLSAYLPKDVGVNTSESEPKEKIEILIKVIKEGDKRDPKKVDQPWGGEGRFEYVGRECSFHIGPRKTEDVEDLGRRLAVLYQKDPERPATIGAYPGTVYGDVVPVLDKAIEAGFTDITFIGEYASGKKK